MISGRADHSRRIVWIILHLIASAYRAIRLCPENRIPETWIQQAPNGRRVIGPRPPDEPIKIGIIAAGLAASASIVFVSIRVIKGMRKISWERFFPRVDRHGRILRASAAGAVLITGAMNLAAWSLLHQSRTSRLPNIVWITIDALRADHLGCYGYEKKTSPFIDSLAANGNLFQRAYQPGILHPCLRPLLLHLHLRLPASIPLRSPQNRPSRPRIPDSGRSPEKRGILNGGFRLQSPSLHEISFRSGLRSLRRP